MKHVKKLGFCIVEVSLPKFMVLTSFRYSNLTVVPENGRDQFDLRIVDSQRIGYRQRRRTGIVRAVIGLKNGRDAINRIFMRMKLIKGSFKTNYQKK